MAQEEKPTIPNHIKNKHTDDLIDHYWGSINYVSNLIRASEIKAGLVLSFYGILLNFIYQSVQMIHDAHANEIIVYGLLSLWFCCTIASIFFSVRCFIPRLEVKYDKNIFFFRDVVSKFGNINEFSKTFFDVSVDEDKIFLQLGHQIYINSKIATMKFKDVNRSIRFLAIGIFLLLILVGYYVIKIL